MILILLILVILFITFFMLYKKYTKRPIVLLKDTHKFNGTKEIIIPSIDLKDNEMNTRQVFTLVFGIKTENIPVSELGNQPLSLFKRGESFTVNYNPQNGNFEFNIMHSKDSNYKIILDNVPNQRWVEIKFCLNGRRAIIFLDNTLTVADIIPGVPLVKDRELIIGSKYKGFVGSIKDVLYYNYCAT